MIENILAQKAAPIPRMMPRMYVVSKVKIRYIPKIIIIPAMMSTLAIFCFLMIGSRIAVKRVKEDRHTSVTDTVDTFMDSKKRTQWRPTNPPVTTYWRNWFRVIFIDLLLTTKYTNKETEAINTRYQTRWSADTWINTPNIPVKPQIRTVRCNNHRFFEIPLNILNYLGALMIRYTAKIPNRILGIRTAISGGRFPFRENIVANCINKM